LWLRMVIKLAQIIVGSDQNNMIIPTGSSLFQTKLKSCGVQLIGIGISCLLL